MIDVVPGSAVAVRPPSLVVLVGPAGSGKSTLARSLFEPYEVLSSDHCRAMIADSEADQSVTSDAFELLRFIAQLRLKNGKLVVVDATNVRRSARERNLELAERAGVEIIALVLDIPLAECLRRNIARRDRMVPEDAVRVQRAAMDATLESIDAEGFDHVYRLAADTMDSVTLERIEANR
jgi:protein phosphatase